MLPGEDIVVFSGGVFAISLVSVNGGRRTCVEEASVDVAWWAVYNHRQNVSPMNITIVHKKHRQYGKTERMSWGTVTTKRLCRQSPTNSSLVVLSMPKRDSRPGLQRQSLYIYLPIIQYLADRVTIRDSREKFGYPYLSKQSNPLSIELFWSTASNLSQLLFICMIWSISCRIPWATATQYAKNITLYLYAFLNINLAAKRTVSGDCPQRCQLLSRADDPPYKEHSTHAWHGFQQTFALYVR